MPPQAAAPSNPDSRPQTYPARGPQGTASHRGSHSPQPSLNAPRHPTGRPQRSNAAANSSETRPGPTTMPCIAPPSDPPTAHYTAGHCHRITRRTPIGRSPTTKEPLDATAETNGHPPCPTAPNPCPQPSNPPNRPKPPNPHIMPTGATRNLTVTGANEREPRPTAPNPPRLIPPSKAEK